MHAATRFSSAPRFKDMKVRPPASSSSSPWPSYSGCPWCARVGARARSSKSSGARPVSPLSCTVRISFLKLARLARQLSNDESFHLARIDIACSLSTTFLYFVVRTTCPCAKIYRYAYKPVSYRGDNQGYLSVPSYDDDDDTACSW